MFNLFKKKKKHNKLHQKQIEEKLLHRKWKKTKTILWFTQCHPDDWHITHEKYHFNRKSFLSWFQQDTFKDFRFCVSIVQMFRQTHKRCGSFLKNIQKLETWLQIGNSCLQQQCKISTNNYYLFRSYKKIVQLLINSPELILTNKQFKIKL